MRCLGICRWEMRTNELQSKLVMVARDSRGITAPAIKSGLDNILLWWRPEHGEKFGYSDGWSDNGTAFYFSGAGQTGDQEFGHNNFENGRVRDHVVNQEHIRLLRYVGPNAVRYLGEMRLDPENPWQWRDGPDRYGETRKIIQFRMLPVGDVLRLPEDGVHFEPGASPKTEQISDQIPPPTATDIEALGKKEFQRLIAARSTISRRIELALVHEFRDWLASAHQLIATGLLIPYHAESRNLRVDMFIHGPQILVEAKSSSSREKLRMAIWAAPRLRTVDRTQSTSLHVASRHATARHAATSEFVKNRSRLENFAESVHHCPGGPALGLTSQRSEIWSE